MTGEPRTDARSRAVQRVLERGVLTQGPEVDALEQEFAEWIGTEPECVAAVSSGTAALTALLVAHGIGPGKKVLVPSATFTATALAVLRAGAEPIFAPVRNDWCLMMPQELDVDAIIAVDFFGIPADWEIIPTYAKEKGIPVIEDACQALGTKFRDANAGMLHDGAGAAFSMNVTKKLVAGEGGLVVASAEVARTVRQLRFFGEAKALGVRRSTLLGDNWKLPELSAAVARASLETLETRCRNGREYGAELLDAAEGLGPMGVTADMEVSWHTVPLTFIDAETAHFALAELAEGGVPVQAADVAPLHTHPAFKGPGGRGPKNTGADALMELEDRYRRTILIGNRTRPLFTWSSEEARQHVRRVHALP